MKALFGSSAMAGAAGAGDDARGEAPNVKGLALDGAIVFTGPAGGCSGARLGAGAGTDPAGFVGVPNVKGGATDGVVAVGFSHSFGSVGAPDVEGVTAESGLAVANADTG